ncbi:MAG: hydroxymethylbilane synthase [Myxococcota bacterium]|jgi:hydroxymethylbilane synthase
MTVIGTRGSELALWQTHYIQGRLGGEAAGITTEIIKTSGDRLLDIPLQNQLDKGFFTKELEVALADRRVDVAVHSLKDLPTQMPPGLVLAAVPERADVGDVLFVHRDRVDLSRRLPVVAGARVGTASMRRSALLQHVDPEAKPEFLRGNVPTRLNKAKTGELDAVLLARAGVSRLGLDWGDLVVFDLDPQWWLPAAAQGALGIQARADDTERLRLLATVHHAPSAQAVALERGLLRRLEGGCHSAFGALGRVDASGVATLRAGLTDTAGAWHAIEVAGDPESLIERAYEALQTVLAGKSHPARLDTTEAQWATPARPWS